MTTRSRAQVDITEGPTEYLVKADVPGFARDQVKIGAWMRQRVLMPMLVVVLRMLPLAAVPVLILMITRGARSASAFGSIRRSALWTT